jgi:large subunit ribosomal protein L30
MPLISSNHPKNKLRIAVKPLIRLNLIGSASRMAKKKETKLQITLVRSPIGYSKKQKNTLKALGLMRINQMVTHKDNEALRGMINKVSHLVTVEEA